MTTLLMSGFGQYRQPTRTLREAARNSQDPMAGLVAAGRVTDWDLVTLKSRSSIPGAVEWAEKTLESIVAAAAAKPARVLDCLDCTDLGFYGITDPENEDKLVGLLRREGDGGYEELTAAGWKPYATRYDRTVEILTRELAADLAEAITAGASGLVRRYFWPLAFLPPEAMTASAPAGEVVEKVTAGPNDGWTEYAIVDDLDPGAVLELIRLRPGPELLAYRNGVWDEAPELLAQLQGVQPPPLVELTQEQLDSVLAQVGGSEDQAQREDAEAQVESSTAEAEAPVETSSAVDEGDLVAAAGALVADAPLTVSPDPRAEKLRRYWTTGKGAAKIRWGTPGDWTRCYRQLRKYMGVRAKGYCQNLHKRATGQWAGARGNRGGGRTAALAASGIRPAVQSMEAALVAAVSTGRWIGPGGGEGMTLKDGIYAEAGDNGGLIRTLTAGGFPVAPPDDWFEDPKLEGPTPLTVDDDGRVYGHIATFDIAHIGLPGRVHAPKSRSGYSYFRTGQLITASGKRVNVGQLTLAGGHAPLQADASAAVAHYDNTASAVADVNCGEDRFGIWVAGGVRPEVTPTQLRTLRASAPSGDWRPINGNLEMVAVCQVNVPGFPTTRARVASGAITALVAAGARPLAARRAAMLADAAVAERLTALEAIVYGVEDGPDLVGDEVVVADGEPVAEAPSVTEGTEGGEGGEESAPAVSENVRKARELAAQRRAAKAAEEAPDVAEDPETQDESDQATEAEQTEEPPAEEQTDPEAQARADRLAALRARVHGNVGEPVAAAAAG